MEPSFDFDPNVPKPWDNDITKAGELLSGDDWQSFEGFDGISLSSEFSFSVSGLDKLLTSDQMSELYTPYEPVSSNEELATQTNNINDTDNVEPELHAKQFYAIFESSKVSSINIKPLLPRVSPVEMNVQPQTVKTERRTTRSMLQKRTIETKTNKIVPKSKTKKNMKLSKKKYSSTNRKMRYDPNKAKALSELIMEELRKKYKSGVGEISFSDVAFNLGYTASKRITSIIICNDSTNTNCCLAMRP